MSTLHIAPRRCYRALLSLPQHQQAVALVRNERAHQIALGFGPDHDALHSRGELIAAASSYSLHAAGYPHSARESWPWIEEASFHPAPSPLANLVKSAALLLSEIERRLVGLPPDELAACTACQTVQPAPDEIPEAAAAA